MLMTTDRTNNFIDSGVTAAQPRDIAKEACIAPS
jgi:hypothetical protein